MRIALSCAFAVGILFLLGVPIWAEPDVFMRTVSFALTGRDDADPKVIGARTNCVFAVKYSARGSIVNELAASTALAMPRAGQTGRRRHSVA